MRAAAVEVVAIGNELVLGETVDTNTNWIARRLAHEGMRVVRTTSVGDDAAAIQDAVRDALARTGAVVCTGGLGPTLDDLTRDAIAALYDREQRVDERWLDVLRERYARRGIPMPEINRVQALVPDGATLLPNVRGTAPGLELADDALGVCYLLPGVPAEMRGLMEDYVVPRLRRRLHVVEPVESRLIRTTGIAESALAERVADIVSNTSPLSIAFLPSLTGVDIRMTHWGDAEPGAAAAAFDRLQRALLERIGTHVYASDDVELAAVVGALLRARRLRLAIAESCTGGLVAAKLTDHAGASDFLIAGFVTYANDAKLALLGVREQSLVQYGAVSEACAREMAEGALRAAGADIAVAITGIAGPGGGSEQKPVGLVWIGTAVAQDEGDALHVTARRTVFPGDRHDIRERAAQAALDTIRRALLPPTT